MKKSILTPTILCALSLGLTNITLAADPTPTPSPTPSSTSSSSKEHAPIAPYNGFLLGSTISGSHIKNFQGEDIGTIHDLVVNPDTGRVRFAVLDVGGFLGMGDDKVVVPWGAIGLEKNKPGSEPSYVIDATKDRLKNAPKFDANKMSDLYKSANAQPIFDYYSITFFEDLPTPEQSKANNKDKSTTPTPTPTPEKK